MKIPTAGEALVAVHGSRMPPDSAKVLAKRIDDLILVAKRAGEERGKRIALAGRHADLIVVDELQSEVTELAHE